MQHLPPLYSLRAFEAAARLSSFAKAAIELNLTAAAVAHQVKKLEGLLGIELFKRHPRGVQLNDAGTVYLEVVQSTLHELSRKTEVFRSQHRNQPIKIGALHIVSDALARPMIRDFILTSPDTQAELIADLPEPDFEKRNLDVTIWYGTTPPDGFISLEIMSETLTPVCAPQILERFGGRLSLENLREIPALYDLNWDQDWKMWLDKVQGPELVNSTGFSLYSTMIRTVIDGGGITIGHTGLLGNKLRDGRLIKPFEQEIDAINKFYALTTTDRLEKRNVQAFWTWMETYIDAADKTIPFNDSIVSK